MKTLSAKLLLGAILLVGITILISSFKTPEETTKKYLSMVVTRSGLKAGNQITIIYETGLPDMVELENGTGKDANINNAVSINSTINSIAGKGYKLVSAVCDNVGVFGTTSYLFEK